MADDPLTVTTPVDAPPPVDADSVPVVGGATRPASGTAPSGHHVAPEIPGYDVVREVSRGGMGVVYEAHQKSLGRTVALKIVLGDARADDVAIDRFLIESRAAAAIVHSHVVRVYDFGECGGRPYLVMEYCPGGTLADGLKAGRMDPTAAAVLVHKLAAGMAAAHARGIVHRDLKPQNVLFDAAGEPKVADFGLAKFAAGANLTRPGDVMGTPAYMAPEQASGLAVGIDTAADVWALGVVLYECLTGKTPFAGFSTAAIVSAVQAADPVPVRVAAPAAPRDLEFICHKCLRKTPGDRYPTAAELATDLGRFLAGEPLAARDRGYRVRRFASRWWKPVALVALVGVLVGGFLAMRPTTNGPDEATLALRREEVKHRVEAVTRGEPHPDRATPHAVIPVDELPKVENKPFRVISDDRVVDLRAWRKLTPTEPSAASFVIFNNRRVLTRIGPADDYRIEYKTTGRDVIVRAVSPNPDAAKLYTTAATQRVGGQEMKVRQLVLDTRSVPLYEEFTAQVVATYRDSLQTPAEQWFGMSGFAGSLRSSILLVFPDDKPFISYTLRVAPPGGGAPQKYDGRVIAFAAEDRRWLYWEVPRPLEGHVYRVDWTW